LFALFAEAKTTHCARVGHRKGPQETGDVAQNDPADQ